ncbi:MAG: Dam family site-specific DNA-(adenine-N6)-methyltransferase [Gammaproteobacteria bacterium]|nr:Dam family site-specific DNA-(adenine-N6)-methyltransferase [Gammaproteobacteria bacterium]
MQYTKPFLKWAGGKYRLLNIILKHLPKQARLVEPFGGSGAVFLNADNPFFLIAEKNPHLIQLYQQVQQEGESFIDYCATFFNPQTNQSHVYYQKRQEFNACLEPRERAALFLYLNRHGYNGLCRYNSSGIFNVPFGRYDRPYFPQLEMQHFYKKSQQATFVHQDFRETFAALKPHDVIYCDPPYASLSPTAYFSNYTGHGFNDQDQQHLAELARHAQSQGHCVIISNHDTPQTRQYYEHSMIEHFEVQRIISCKVTGGRLMAPELIAIFKP